MSIYMVPVFHHAGTFVTLSNGSVIYLDGKIKKYDLMDIDFMNWKDLVELGKQIGYVKFNRMFWHEPNVIEFDHGLHEITSDRDINEMCDFTMMQNLTEIHIYLDHPADVPIVPEVVVIVPSSSSDSYERVEDEACKPPLPGCKSDDSEDESPKKKTRCTFVNPKKKIMHPKSKRNTGKKEECSHFK
ncbi:hypothetical protein PIB30_079779 [Stylosanthes scabra]|uniref:PB1-like domain-containing protein n=1 Tax=Stylosanthes scabra TaxID=79078 RepID=A0ABU6VTV1_9FABA|nr:hypothetical protein [Stylosanthes scabra]